MDNEKLTNCRKRGPTDDNHFFSPNKKRKDSIKMEKSQKLRQNNTKYLNDEPLLRIFSRNDNELLPFTYKKLLDIFISLDLIVNKLINNREPLYIDRIKKVLLQMNKKEFDVMVFGQILSVFPESYQYQCDKSPLKTTLHHSDGVQIFPNLRFAIPNDSSPRKTEKSLSLSQLIVRRNTFRDRLLALVKETHDAFLLNVKKMKIEDIKEMKIVRWCSDFDLGTVENVPSKILDRNNILKVHSVVKTSETNVSVEKSDVCKDLFGTCGLKRENGTEKVVSKRVSTPKEHDQRPTLRTKSTVRQSQLSFNLIDDKRPGKVQTPTKQKLPFHLKALLEFFVVFDKTVHSLYSRGELAYLSSVLKTSSMVKTYTVSHFGQLMTVYPEGYKLRWERVLNKITFKATNRMDVVITPQLRNDGTKIASTSPTKGFIKFDCVRLKQRSDKFQELCAEIVERSYKAYGARNELEGPFNVDLHVEMVAPASLPPKTFSKYSDEGNRIKSIADMFAVIKQRNEPLTKDCVKTEHVGEKIRSIPQTILDRVRQNKLERHLFAKNDVAVRRRLLLERLPKLAMTLHMELGQRVGHQPVARSRLLPLVYGSTGICEDDFDESVNLLNEVVPDYIRFVDWTLPCLQLGTSRVSSLDIQNKVASLLNG